MDKPVATIWLPGRGVGKARPRVGRKGRVFMPERYTNWKDNAAKEIIKQVRHQLQAPQPCYVKCWFVNFLSSDSDNLTGSVLDALVDAGYLQGDSSSFVLHSAGEFCKTKKKRNVPKPMGILVEIYSAEIKTIVLEDLIDGNGMACA